MKYRVHNPFHRWPVFAIAVLLVGGCATVGPGAPVGERRAEQLATAGKHADAAGRYIGLASEATGRERDRLTLLAVEQWLEAGDGSRARSAMRSVPEPESGPLRWLWLTDTAALALRDGRPDDALALLEPLAREPLDERHRLRAEALLADTWFQKGDPIRALDLYRQREAWLSTAADVRQNRQRMWAGLLVSRPATLREAAAMVDDPEIRGWLELGALAVTTGQQGIGWGNGVARWQQQYAGHPATSLLSGMDLPESGRTGYPQHVALLLPLAGESAAAGEAVQNGFLGAYFSAAGDPAAPQRVSVYNSQGGTAIAYENAVTDGAEFIIGPLLRGNVTDLATGSLLPVPVLALNYLPDNLLAPPEFYQFALAPEDEAVAAARQALADGHRRALALVPRSDWGRRLLNSFASAFESNGGTVLEARNYEPDKQDFSFEIENLMLLSQSVQRYQRLRANIGGPLQFDPRRRQDADFIFLAATAPTGRLLKSQLKFHYAGDLPVYATSRIYSLDERSNSDLNGLMFADTPWIISPPPRIAKLPELYNRYWPQERGLGRLHALGYDAFHLVGALYSTDPGDMPEIDGATGRLYLDSDGRIHRRLAWARFENGEPVPVAPPEQSGDDVESRNQENGVTPLDTLSPFPNDFPPQDTDSPQ